VALVPGLFVDDLAAAAYNATDGGADPYAATMAYARRAPDLGVEIAEDEPVLGVDTSRGRVAAVHTPRRTIPTRVVVNAAGPWSGEIGRMVGIDVPVRPYRREIYVSEPFDLLPKEFPLVIDLHVGWYVRRKGPGILMSGNKEHSLELWNHPR
jgi:sarcosine oxidase subunit beta